MEKTLLIVLLIAFLLACNKDGGIVNPSETALVFSNSRKWVEVVQVDFSGIERVAGNFTVENTLEFFDSTYEFTSNTIFITDSTNIIEEHFSLHHWGKFSSRNDTLTIFTFDRIYSSTLKTIISKVT